MGMIPEETFTHTAETICFNRVVFATILRVEVWMRIAFEADMMRPGSAQMLFQGCLWYNISFAPDTSPSMLVWGVQMLVQGVLAVKSDGCMARRMSLCSVTFGYGTLPEIDQCSVCLVDMIGLEAVKSTGWCLGAPHEKLVGREGVEWLAMCKIRTT